MSFINKNNLKKIFPFLVWFPELKDKQVLKTDTFAGITIAIILIPQAMAYASLVGVPPHIGLYTAFLPVIIGGLFSSSRQLSTGPVTIISLMTAATLAPFTLGISDFIMYASILAIMIGVLQLTLGILKLGSIFNFISHSVIIGFINAAALITIISQLKKIFGIHILNDSSIFSTILELSGKIINETHLYTFLFGSIGIFSLYLLKRFIPKIPRFLFVVIISIVISKLIGFDDMGGKIVGEIPKGLPSFYMPEFSFEILSKLFMGAIVVGFLGFTEAISIAKAIGLETKKTVSTNQMLFSEGLANLASGFSKGFPISATFSRSAVNLKSGAQTQFSSLVTGLIIGIVLLFFTEYLYYLPEATLAAIIIFAVFSLIQFKPIIKAWKIQKHDAIISIITFTITIIFSPNLETGIYAGIVLSLIMHLYQSMKPRFSELSMAKDGAYRDSVLHGLETSKKIGIYKFYGKLFFVNIRYFEGKLMKYIEENPEMKVIVIDFDMIPYIDSSAMEVLETIIMSMEKFDIEVYFTGIHSNLWNQFEATGYLTEFGKHNIFPNISNLIGFLKNNRRDLDMRPLLEYCPIKKTDT